MSKLSLGLLAGLLVVLCFAFFISTVVLSVLLDRCKRPTSPTLPRLKEQPEIEDVTTSTIRIAWKKDHHGDGDICGYIVNLKSPSSISWSSVGFVPFNETENVYQYTIDRLDAQTQYGISVAILHCTGGQGEMSSELRQATMDYILPSLSEKAVGATFATIKWQRRHTVDYPICGYAVDSRSLIDDVQPWANVGFLPLEPGSEYSGDPLFNLTHLEPATEYQVSVRPVLCDGTLAKEPGAEPVLDVTTSPIALPTLSEAPQSTSLTSSSVALRWTNQYEGDGPICGYVIFIKVSRDEEPWLSVGFVPVDADHEYEIDHLEANTAYQVAVALNNCFSAREGPLEPILQIETLPIALPTLLEAPQNTSLTSSSVALRWTNQYEGDGPICGYVIFIRVNGDKDPWLSVGFEPVDADLEYEIDHLEGNTAYQVAVALISCFSARGGPREPILQIKTLPIEARTTEPRASESMSTTPQIPAAVQNCTTEFPQPIPVDKSCKDPCRTCGVLMMMLFFLVLGFLSPDGGRGRGRRRR